jgi:hypothetical protein
MAAPKRRLRAATWRYSRDGTARQAHLDRTQAEPTGHRYHLAGINDRWLMSIGGTIPVNKVRVNAEVTSGSMPNS